MKRLAFILSFCVLLLARLDGQSSTSRWAVWARQHANPISALQSNADDAFEDVITLSYIPNTYSQTIISSDMPNVSAELKVTKRANCP